MKFGRREQQVVLGILFFVGIGLLHTMVFSPQGTRYKKSLAEKVEAQGQLKSKKRIRDRRDVTLLNEVTKELGVYYEEAKNSLNLTYNPAFIPPATIPGITPDMSEEAKAEIIREVVREQYNTQLDLVLAEVQKLLDVDAEQKLKPAEEQTKLSFLYEGLGSGWRLPQAVPAEFNDSVARLQDVLLKEIKETLLLMESISSSNAQLKAEQRVNYEQSLMKIGIDNNLFRDITPDTSLAAQGPYVPFINKSRHATLLLEVAGDPDKDITRDSLYRWLEIRPPFEKMGTMPVGEIYFMYESLRYLNQTVSMMVEHKVDNVIRIVIQNPRYLVETGELAFASSASVQPRMEDAPVVSTTIINYANDSLLDAPPEFTIVEANPPPGGSDLGYALPIRYQFIASNTEGWSLLYDVIGKFPLSEIDEVVIATNPEGLLFWDVTFVYVPFLFTVQGNAAVDEPEPTDADGETDSESGEPVVDGEPTPAEEGGELPAATPEAEAVTEEAAPTPGV